MNCCRPCLNPGVNVEIWKCHSLPNGGHPYYLLVQSYLAILVGMSVLDTSQSQDEAWLKVCEVPWRSIVMLSYSPINLTWRWKLKFIFCNIGNTSAIGGFSVDFPLYILVYWRVNSVRFSRCFVLSPCDIFGNSWTEDDCSEQNTRPRRTKNDESWQWRNSRVTMIVIMIIILHNNNNNNNNNYT